MDSNLFVRGNDNKSDAEENIWDDTALIKAYDKAVNLAKEEVAKRMSLETQKSQSKQKSHNLKPVKQGTKKWTVGAPCRAVYSEDGEVYEAIISKIYENTGMCIVKFVGYGNTEKVELQSLLESEGLEKQIAQQKEATKEECETNDKNYEDMPSDPYLRINGNVGEQMECDTEGQRSREYFAPGTSFDPMFSTMPPAPPLPPQLMAKLPENDTDALSSMLMSWYISGFHTGYYHGLKQAREKQEKRRAC